tara:strand:- start:365 stop:601 length:237 start_codon:yes stop_codon:yes gene_type:complete
MPTRGRRKLEVGDRVSVLDVTGTRYAAATVIQIHGYTNYGRHTVRLDSGKELTLQRNELVKHHKGKKVDLKTTDVKNR